MYFETNCLGGSPDEAFGRSGFSGLDFADCDGQSNCFALEEAKLGMTSVALKD